MDDDSIKRVRCLEDKVKKARVMTGKDEPKGITLRSIPWPIWRDFRASCIRCGLPMRTVLIRAMRSLGTEKDVAEFMGLNDDDEG